MYCMGVMLVATFHLQVFQNSCKVASSGFTQKRTVRETGLRCKSQLSAEVPEQDGGFNWTRMTRHAVSGNTLQMP